MALVTRTRTDAGGGIIRYENFLFANGFEPNLIDLSQRPWGAIVATGQVSAMQAVGAITQRTIDVVSAAGYGPEGVFLRQDTGAVLLSEAFMTNIVGAGPTRRGFNPKLLFKFGINQTTDIRMFVGLLDATVADGVILASDDPAAQYVGLQYSTSRGDVNFQFVTDDGVTQNLVDSGIAASPAVFFLRVLMSPGAIKLEILDAATFSVLASHTFVANLVGPTTKLVVLSGIITLAVVVKSIRQFYINLVNGT